MAVKTLVQFDPDITEPSQPHPDNVLYGPADLVAVNDIQTADIQTIIDDLVDTKREYGGVGIAAPQIGINKQIFIIELLIENNRYQDMQEIPLQVFINPVITKVSASKVGFWHGCLSALNCQKGLVASYEWLEIKAFNQHGEEFEQRFDNPAAIVIQHEFRHLLGGGYFNFAKEFMDWDAIAELGPARIIPYQESIPLLLKGYTIGQIIQ